MRTKNSTETKRAAAALAKKILAGRAADQAAVIALIGDLGAGKTTFVQGFARALGVKSRMVSPTFLIFRKYELSDKKFTRFYHADAYRIKKISELKPLGFKEIIDDPHNIVIIEWANLVSRALPEKFYRVRLAHGKKESERIISIEHP